MTSLFVYILANATVIVPIAAYPYWRGVLCNDYTEQRRRYDPAYLGWI